MEKLSYVAGIVDKVKLVQAITNRKEEQQLYLDFTISDFMVHFWDELAQAFESLYYAADDHPVIIIIHLAKVVRNEYSGAFSLSTMAATSFDLNSNCARVDAYVRGFGMSMVFKWIEGFVYIPFMLDFV
ncbi:hypothetical protein AgCh_012319 [Apium graveolens]